MNLKLEAKNATEQRVLDYLGKNASETLVERINSGRKTIAGALEYAKEQARSMANGASCICVDDQTVFGWIIHFFEEDDVKQTVKNVQKKIISHGNEEQKKAKNQNKQPRLSDDCQMTLFESLFQ